MKRLVIKPTEGRATVSLIGHKYLNKAEAAAAGRERGTQVIYLGSFSRHLEPHKLDGVERIRATDIRYGVRIKPGVVLDDEPFELNAADVQEIQSWLFVHGTWAREQETTARRQTAQERARADERAQLEIKLRAELSAQLRPELQAELEAALVARRGHLLEEAVRAVQAAGAAVREEAARLKSGGHRMTTRRGKAEAEDQDLEPANRLLELTLALRKQAFAEFEEDCKAAGLMAGRKPSAAKRRAPKAH